ncbi:MULTISPECIES: MFS transporter [Pseudomonas]|uniref:MFS transporter n=1 Tax=Pseudomonas TaxID=286 RepID=UPI001E401529|nr:MULTISPECIES: MFS transporter [Pseudomonas]MCD4527817.1 hypothetical protein [Pseudomonas sp. C3-2018]
MPSLGPAETEFNAGSSSDVPRKTNNLQLMLNLSALMSFASISTDMYLPTLPAIGRALQTDSAGVELTFSAFLIGFSLGQLIWGPISDRVGRNTFVAYWRLIRHPHLIGYALSGGFFLRRCLCLYRRPPFAYIDFYQVSPQTYGWLFGFQ